MSFRDERGVQIPFPCAAASVSAAEQLYDPWMGLTAAEERDAAMPILTQAGFGDRAVGRLLGVHGATVGRNRRRGRKRFGRPKRRGLTYTQIVQLVREYAADPDLLPEQLAVAIDWLEKQRTRISRRAMV